MPRLAGLILVALSIIGCGDNDGPAGSGAESGISVETGVGSKAEFIERADAICRASSKKAEAEFVAFLARNKNPSSSPDGYQDAAEQVVETIYIPASEAQIDRISSLGAPEGDEESVAAVLEALQASLDEAESHPLRFVRALSSAYKPFAEAERLATAYGFSECGKG